MNRRTPDGRDADTSSDRVERALSAAIDQRGPALLREPARLKAVLVAVAPDATRVIDAIVGAVANQVPQAMLAAHSEEHLASILPGLVDRLMSVAPLDHGQATWTVRAWAKALALPTRGLEAGASSTVAASATTAVPDQRASIAAVIGPKSRPAPVTVAPVVEPARPADAVAPMDEPSAEGGDRETSAVDPVAFELVADTGIPTSPATPQGTVVAPPTVETPAPPALVAASAPPSPIGATEPVPAPPSLPASPSARSPASSRALPPVLPSVLPPARSEAIVPAVAVANSRSRRLIAALAAIIVVVVVVGFGAWRWMVTPSVVTLANEEPRLALAPATAAPSTSAPSTAAPSIDRPPMATAAAAVEPSGPAAAAPSAVEAPSAPPPKVDDRPSARSPSIASTAMSSSPPKTPPAHAATTVTVPRVATAAASVAVAAPIATPATTVACTRDRCGSVVSVRAASDDGSASQGPNRGYEMTIRMDDRSIRTMTRQQPSSIGSRVRMTGTGFVPLAP